MINPRSVHFQKKKKGLLFEFSHLCTFNGIVCLSPQVPPQNTTTMTAVGGYVSYETLQLKRLEMEMWDCCCFDSVCSETPRRCEFCPQQKIHQNPARVLLGKARTWKTDAKKMLTHGVCPKKVDCEIGRLEKAALSLSGVGS